MNALTIFGLIVTAAMLMIQIHLYRRVGRLERQAAQWLAVLRRLDRLSDDFEQVRASSAAAATTPAESTWPSSFEGGRVLDRAA